MLRTSTDDVFAEIGQRHHCLDVGVAGDDDADRLQALAVARRRQQDAQLLAFLEAAVAAARAERRGDRLDFLGLGAEVAQHRGDGIALLERDGALVPGIAAGGLRGRLGSSVMFSGAMRGSKPA